MCDSYSFDLNKASHTEIGNRAVELCEEFAGNYPEGSIEHAAFMALQVHWLRVNETRSTPAE